MRVLIDFHHQALFRSLVTLFEDRLGFEVYRPIGLDWHTEGYWAVHDHPDTAKQFLGMEQGYRPADGTPPLNELAPPEPGWGRYPDGVYLVNDPATPDRPVKACTLDFFKNTSFDLIIASIPQHLPLYMRLAANFQPGAHVAMQVGNEWALHSMPATNILASVAPRPVPDGANVCWYSQEFDLEAFRPEPVIGRGVMSCFINVLDGGRLGEMLNIRESAGMLAAYSFGGQCRDGCITGVHELGDEMRGSDIIYHVKPGGDGYGHVLHNAFAVGRPVITRRSHYRGQLGDQLLTRDTCIDLDGIRAWRAGQIIKDLGVDGLTAMGQAAADRFREVVDFDEDEANVRCWLENLV